MNESDITVTVSCMSILCVMNDVYMVLYIWLELLFWVTRCGIMRQI